MNNNNILVVVVLLVAVGAGGLWWYSQQSGKLTGALDVAMVKNELTTIANSIDDKSLLDLQRSMAEKSLGRSLTVQEVDQLKPDALHAGLSEDDKIRYAEEALGIQKLASQKAKAFAQRVVDSGQQDKLLAILMSEELAPIFKSENPGEVSKNGLAGLAVIQSLQELGVPVPMM